MRVGETATGVVISVFLCFVLILIGHRFDPMQSYRDLFFAYWAQYVCCCLTLGAFAILASIWKVTATRKRCLESLNIPQPEAIATPSDIEALFSKVSDVGRSCKDDLIKAEINRLTNDVKSLKDSSIFLWWVDSQSMRLAGVLDAEFASVRTLCWIIPIVGLIGTVLALSQTIAMFSSFLVAGDHTPEDLRRALASAESNLSSALQPLVIAVLSAVIISVLWSVVAQKQKTILRLLVDASRSFLLSIVGWQHGSANVISFASESQPVVDSALEKSSEMAPLQAILQSIRLQIAELRPTLYELSATFSEHNSDDIPRSKGASAAS